MVTEENSLPYCPAVLPYLLAGKVQKEKVWLRTDDYFASKKIVFLQGKRVIKVNPQENRVTYLDGQEESYDNLLIATGAEATSSPFDNIKEEILSFHRLEDLYRLNKRLISCENVTILGAGLVAVELAVALTQRGKKVRILGRGRLLRAYFTEEAGNYLSEHMERHGIEIITGKTLSSFKKRGNSYEIDTEEGDTFKADMIIACLGVKPNLSFLTDSGIHINHGVVVDRCLKTNFANIFAIGDVAESPAFFGETFGVSPILPNALDQGRVAAENMAGKVSYFQGWLPMNVLKLFDNLSFSIGIISPEDGGASILEEKNGEKKTIKRLVIRDDSLVGAMFINCDVEPGVIRYLIERRVNVGDYADALMNKPRITSFSLMIKKETSVNQLV